MTYDEFMSLAETQTLLVRCPDGEMRTIWGYNKDTGDVLISGWDGAVWVDASRPMACGVEFDPLPA